MTDINTIRPSIVTVPKSQVIEKAATLDSTFDDTTAWPTENGHKVLDGNLALSTTAATVITNAENLYPDLWARTPVGWKSGSDLTVPAQNLSGIGSFGLYLGQNGGSVNHTPDIVDTHVHDSTGNYTVTFKAGIFSAAPSIVGVVDDNSGSAIGTTVRVHSSGSTAFSYTITDSSNAAYDAGINFVVTPTENLKLDTPTISLYDNTLSISVGLPPAKAEVKGLVNLDSLAEGQRNYFINPAFEINQRGTSFVSSGAEYTSDRWRKDDTGSSQNQITINDETNVFNGRRFEKYLKTKSGNTSAGSLYIGQRCEDVRETAAKTMTLSVVARSTQLTELKFSCQQNFGSGGDSAVIFADLLQATLTADFALYTATFELPTVEGKTIGADSFLNCYFEILADGTTNPEADILYTKLEQGTEATKFTRAGGTYAGELGLCQRYFEKSIDQDGVLGSTQADYLNHARALSFSSASGLTDIQFKQTKRNAPSVTIYSRSGVAGKCTQDSNGNDHGNVTAVTSSDSTIFSITTDATISDNVRFYWAADSEL